MGRRTDTKQKALVGQKHQLRDLLDTRSRALLQDPLAPVAEESTTKKKKEEEEEEKKKEGEEKKRWKKKRR